MRVAAIDIGTNSVRLLTAKIENHQLNQKVKKLSMTRIGKDVDATHFLQEERIEATIQALAEFKSEIESMQIPLCPVFATSAVRDAKNRQEFIDRVKIATGFDVEVIDGNKEAKLGFLGVVSGSGELAKQGNSLIIDIGGGSTELIVGNPQGEIVHAYSLNIGAVRLTDRHNLKHQAQWSDFQMVVQDVEAALMPLLPLLNKSPIASVFGIGGTATTVGAINLQLEVYDSEAIHLSQVTTDQVHQIAQQLVKASLEEKLQIKGLMPKRADIIAAGVVILDTILRLFDLNSYIVSDEDNLEGSIYEQMR